MTTEPATPETPATPSTPETPTTDRLPDDHPAAKALAKANKEAETLRLKLQEIEDRDKSELQKLQDAVAERDVKLAEQPKAVRSQVLRFASAASQRGFLDPEDALAFMPETVDLADSTAVKAALDELAERKPHLVRKEAKKLPERPKAKAGAGGDDGPDKGLVGKERAAAALRQFSNTR